LTTTATPSAATTSSAATPVTPKAAQAVKELQIALEPTDLGAMTLKLRLADGKLSVTISVSNPQTLAAIKDDSALIAQRLASNDSALDDLVIQSQAHPPSTTETSHASEFADDSNAKQESSKGESNPSGSRQNSQSRDSARDGRGFSDLIV
jgi:flagellar hook-length control protein FliK